MINGELRWEPSVLEDPTEGRIVLWPHLPCVRMPSSLRYRGRWDGLALLFSQSDLSEWRQDEKQDKESPGVHIQAAIASGTVLGRLMKDLQEYEVDGPKIPDPEQVRLLLHADNARGGMPIYAIEPDLDDSDWTEWLESSADKQASMANLLSTLTTSRRWKKTRSGVIPKVTRNDAVDADMGAAAASCAAWWIEEQGALTEELLSQRNTRFAARLRGALADLINSRVDDAEASDCTLLVPVHQAWLPSLEAAVKAWPDPEPVNMEVR
mgnify:CR=1 FL=1